MAVAPRLHGRDHEVRVLNEALDQAVSGRLAVVLLEGEAGIGKTRLLTDILDHARDRGCVVMCGRAEELEQSRPFGAIARAFGCTRTSADPRRALIAALLATYTDDSGGLVTVTTDPGLRFRVVDAFTDLAEEVALEQTLVIGLDDLQWADPSSLLTLRALGDRLCYLPVALIGSWRPVPRAPELGRVIESLERAGARRLALGPLSERAVADMVAETVGAEPGPGLLMEIAGAAGNPLFVLELLSAMVQEGAIKRVESRAEVVQMTLPPTLRLTILRRVSSLPADTLQVLRAASILGSSFSLFEISAVTGRSALELSGALEEAIRAGVLEEVGARLRFRHELIRAAIYEDLPAGMRRDLHHEAAQRLAASGCQSLQVAEQFTRGSLPGDTEAANWLTRAAREAAPRSPEVAADLLKRAAGLMDPQDPSRDHLIVERAATLMLTSLAEAERECRDLLRRHHSADIDGIARSCLGQAVLSQGRAREALQQLEQVHQSAGLTDAQRALAEAWTAVARLSLGDLNGAATMAGLARDAAAAAGDALATTMAISTLALVAEYRGNLVEASRIAETGVRLADESPGRVGHSYPLLPTQGHILMELDRPADALHALETGMLVSEQLGARWDLPTYHNIRALVHFIAGEWDDAIADMDTSAALSGETGETYTRTLAYAMRSMIALHRNDLAAAEKAAELAACDLTATGPLYRAHWSLWARALVLEARGDVAGALADLASAWDACRQWGLALEYLALGADLVRLAVAADDVERARDAAAAVSEVAARNEVPSLTATAQRCRGLADGDPEALLAAAESYAHSPRRLEIALACEDAAAAVAKRGESERAGSLLRHAAAIYGELGAARDIARTEAALRGLGIHRGRRGPRNRPSTGWGSLTSAENAVIALVAEGLSNPQIGERLYLSRRTVQTHLAHVFAKLGINSRAQLAAEVTRLRTSPARSRRAS